MSEGYAAARALMTRRHHLQQAGRMLGWDQRVMAPPGAAAARGEMLAALRGEAHALLCGDALGEALDGAGAAKGADDWGRAHLREIARMRARALRLPSDLPAAETRAATRGEAAWRAAREADDFAMLAPHLEEIVALARERAAALAEGDGVDARYTALIGEFEPELAAEEVSALFDDLAAFIPDFRRAAVAKQAALPPPEPIAAPPERQAAAARRLMAALGFDFARGRLDVSAHPFCSGCDDDVRVTTRFDEADALKALFAALHETGHALYEQNLPVAERDGPAGRARGMVAHESQSLLVEMQIARGAPFLGFAAPILREEMGAASEDPRFTPEALARSAQRLSETRIRVDADEIAYPLHIILRMRLERALIAGDLAVCDLPAAWAEEARRLFGWTPADDREGCLQDIHWPAGHFGYFPTYALGALAAAQLYEGLAAARPTLEQEIAVGDFAEAAAWLRTTVHERASRESFAALMRRATGAPLGTAAFKRRLARRYGAEGEA